VGHKHRVAPYLPDNYVQEFSQFLTQIATDGNDPNGVSPASCSRKAHLSCSVVRPLENQEHAHRPQHRYFESRLVVRQDVEHRLHRQVL
jgi:hypothetical protein